MKKIGQVLKADSKKRNPFTNFVLYAVQLVSIVAVIALVPEVLWTISLLDEPDWTLTAVYGKGVIPAFLALISVFISNLLIFNWQKKGLTIMLVSFFAICLPLMKNEYIEFVVFLGFMYGGLLIYWLTLLLKRNGVSTWKQCVGDFTLANSTILAATVFLMGLLPPVTGYEIGFKGELYSMGCDCLDAHLAPDYEYYYKNEMARDIAFSSLWRNDDWHRRSTAENWFQSALHSAKGEYDNQWELKSVYSSYICFLLKEGKSEKAKEQYEEALNYIPKDKLRGAIENDYILKSYLDEFDEFVENLENAEEVKPKSHFNLS